MDKNKWAETLIRARGDMSQAEFANATGVSRSTIALYETRKSSSRPTYNILYRMATVSKVPLKELMIAAGYSEDEIPMEDHPLIEAVHDVLRRHGYPSLKSEDIDMTKEIISSIIEHKK